MTALPTNCRHVAQEFCEDCDGRTKLVRRAPELRSNAHLPAAFERATGERIYEGLRNGFRVPCFFSDLSMVKISGSQPGKQPCIWRLARSFSRLLQQQHPVIHRHQQLETLHAGAGVWGASTAGAEDANSGHRRECTAHSGHLHSQWLCTEGGRLPSVHHPPLIAYAPCAPLPFLPSALLQNFVRVGRSPTRTQQPLL